MEENKNLNVEVTPEVEEIKSENLIKINKKGFKNDKQKKK